MATTSTNPILSKDGASQDRRMLPMLDPDYAPVDERKTEDFLRFAREFAKQIRFYQPDGSASGNWEGFLSENLDLESSLTPAQRERERDKWIKQILRYLDAPDQFQGPAERLARLSQPHLALFLTFLKLVTHIQTQLNATGQRHLEHYYRKTLALTRREALPDLVHAVLQLTEGVEAQVLPAGTLLSAGTDSEGKDIVYRSDAETLLSRANIAALRTVFIEKQRTSVADFHILHADSPTHGFEEMWRIPLGEFGPGTKLPFYVDNFHPVPEPFSETLFQEFTAIQASARTIGGLEPDDLIWLTQLEGDLSNADWAHVLKLMAPEPSEQDAVRWLGATLYRSTFVGGVAAVLDVRGLRPLVTAMQASSAYLLISQADIATIAAIRDREIAALTLDEPLPDWSPAYPLLENAFRKRLVRDRQFDIAAHRRSIVLANKTTDMGFTQSLAYATGKLKEPDGYRLPPYSGILEENIITTLQAQLLSTVAEEQQAAYTYVLETLHIEPLDFQEMLAQRELALGGFPADWDFIDARLEAAQRVRDNISLDAPVLEEWCNLYTFSDATLNLSKPELGIEENDPRWKTFGEPQRNPNEAALRAELGFAIASDLLALSEGEREITLTLSCDSANFNEKTLQTFIEEQDPDAPFFQFFLSGEKAWIRPKVNSISLGAFIADNTGEDVTELYTLEPVALMLHANPGVEFTQADRGDLIVAPGGLVYEIEIINATDHVTLRDTQTIVNNHADGLRRIAPADLLTHSLRILLSLGVQDPAIGAPGEEVVDAPMANGKPLLRILLADLPYQTVDGNETRLKKAYQAFQNLRIQRFHIHTLVSGIQSAFLQNENELIDANKPFAPFTDYPRERNTFYFTHHELAAKRLDSLQFQLNWDQVPSDLVSYYSGYDKIRHDDPQLPEEEFLIQSNADFKAEIMMVDRRVKVSLGNVSLFDAADAQLPVPIELPDLPGRLHQGRPDYRYAPLALPEEPNEEALRWPRYFALVLGERDFRDNEYQELAIRQAHNLDLQVIELKAPVSPKLREFQLAYSASELTTLGQASPSALFHLHPFGFTDVKNAGTTLLPAYTDEGHLYLGIDEAEPGSVIPVLFQMAEGSANPDLAKAPVNWYYLQGDNWQPFGEADIVHDDTNGLLKSGIIRLKVPDLADTSHQLLPSGLIWLRASVATNTDSVSDVIRIVAQAIRATFVDQDNAEDHLFSPLKPNSITSTVEPILGISEISQPFPSTGGRPRESDTAFYTRISERLRHKRRAITMWDYERLVLEAFPDVHKVKCLSANYDRPNEAPGSVTMIVIPDIIGRFPFNPYQPKMPAEKLVEIREYLQRFMSPFAKLSVKNPRYLQVNVRVAVKLRAGYSEGYYKAQLEDDLRRYLAPWAYKEGRDIVFGGKLYANVIVDYIERRPYIDYIGRINLFQSEDGKNFRDARLVNRGENMVRAEEPDIVLVSAVHHQIELIKEGEFQEELPAGIGNARIEVDFYVSENTDIES